MNLGFTKQLGGKMESSISEDIYYGGFIQIPFWRYVYRKVVTLSSLLFSYVIIHLALTRELQKLDLLAFWNNSQHQFTLAVIGGSILALYLADQSEQSLGPQWMTPIRRMYIQLICDLIRVVLYLESFLFLDQQLFSTTQDPDQQLAGVICFSMYVLLVFRKFIFWLNIIFIQKMNPTPWEHVPQPSDLASIKKKTDKEMKKLTTLLQGMPQE